MKSKWSKSSIVRWPAVKDRIRRAEPAAERVRPASKNLDKHRALTNSNTATNNADCA
uniref:Truncated nef protein n=2 Tax=Human immunodeficiency virus type 1 TaxID=11676 RepID=Q3S5G3_HV1|nr:truncated nef protein [Human immunodeficiency virus 1]